VEAVTSPWLDQLRTEVRRRIRAQRSTQQALAAHLGITPKHMSQILNGKVSGSPEMLDRIAAAAGLRIAVVVGDGEPAELPPAAKRGRPPKTPAIFVCGGDFRSGKRDDCPDELHDYPLPNGYADAHEMAASRLAKGWQSVRCKACGLYGWIPGHPTGNPCDQRVPCQAAETVNGGSDDPAT
jgi:transcriptional regulator with XRE-family HTH domain